MEFKVGDAVAVLDDVIKGTVIAVFQHKITIETNDGFPFDFSPKELVVIGENHAELSKYSDVSNDILMEKINEKTTNKNALKFKSSLKPNSQPPMEVDLHIHQLIPSTRGMDNFDILTIQLDTAKRQIEFAIKNRIQRIVFIHGKGEGVLKSELEYLFKKHNVTWYDAPYDKYGTGATEVYVFQNPKN
ncbi:Smr/MutS family protein [Lutibacter sp.]|uniref:Smr/MutS family protein n=1 Tax=Lutibacter sp. TaxID=1925666 RepID=UPI002734498A|nr:Smr/MutS family protein [Lutibacter sp.]MDP3312117.1 DNA mismatch repair protein MutS [Lutibacter sp.]